jgi:hypothetical protein
MEQPLWVNVALQGKIEGPNLLKLWESRLQTLRNMYCNTISGF